MFTKTTITLLGLLVVCEVCTLIVFGYQRTVRKLAMRLKVPQSALAFCYPRWMLAMYWGSFVKFGIIIALFVLDWRCGLVSLGVFALFFGLSIIIPVPDGRNLIWIRRKVKRCGSRAIGVGIYQFLMREIDQGIVATGGDLEKMDAEEHENVGWNTKTSVKNRPRWLWEKAPRAIFNDSTRHDDTISLPSNDLGESSSQTSSSSKPDDERTWRNAPACIKCAIALIGIVIVGGMLLTVFSFKEVSFDLVLFLSCVLLCLFCWAYHILKGKNWTRVFSIAIVILFLCNPGLCYIGSVGFTLLITALLFCPGANKWFVSWPRGWSYWPVLLILPAVVTVISSRGTNGNTEQILRCSNSKNSECPEDSLSRKIGHTSKTRSSSSGGQIGEQASRVTSIVYKRPEDMTDVELDAFIATEKVKLGLVKQENSIVPHVTIDQSPHADIQGIQENAGDKDQSHRSRIGHGDFYEFLSDETIQKIASGKDCFKSMTDEELDSVLLYMIYKIVSGHEELFSEDVLTEMCRKGMTKWIRETAEKGDVASECMMGISYGNGFSVEKNDAIAVKWYEKSAKHDFVLAQVLLSVCYDKGIGIAKNEELASEWRRKAAMHGVDLMQDSLGIMYEYGFVVEKDEAESIKWYRLAARKGNKKAQNKLSKKGLSW